MPHVVFLTGGTGNIGAPLLATMLGQSDVEQIVVLVRGKSVIDAQERLRRALVLATGTCDNQLFSSKVKVVCGDITSVGLGLSIHESSTIFRSITHIVHSAAATQFSLPLECARKINCVGTRNVFEMARHYIANGHLRSVVHLSTAYVCGIRSGVIAEDDSWLPEFPNTYEQTKWETEQIIHSDFSDLPVTILRPSIVVGDSLTGRINLCNVLYVPLRLILCGRIVDLSWLPATSLDVVSTDYIAKAVTHILFRHNNPKGLVIHLTAGKEKSMTTSDILTFATQHFMDRHIPGKCSYRSGLNSRLFLKSRTANSLQLLINAFQPIMSVNHEFNTERRQAILDSAGISPKHLNEYLPQILEFCIRTNWGKIPACEEEMRLKPCAA